MPVPIWAGRYIGLPFAEHGRDRSGIDCWGLARLVLLEQFNISLPSLAHEYRRTADATRIAGLMEREIPRWQAVTTGQERCGDVIVLRLCGQPMHVGVVLGAAAANITPSISGLSVDVDMPDRIYSGRSVAAEAGGLSVVFARAFRDTPAITVTPRDMGTGEYYTITDQGAAGFTIRFFNAGGSGIARSFDYLARGYGEQT